MSRRWSSCCSVRSRSTPTEPRTWPAGRGSASGRGAPGIPAPLRAGRISPSTPPGPGRTRASQSSRPPLALPSSSHHGAPTSSLSADSKSLRPAGLTVSSRPCGIGGEDAVVHAPHDAGQQVLGPARLLLGRPQRVPELLERLHESLGLPVESAKRSSTMNRAAAAAERRRQSLFQADPQLEQLGSRPLVRPPARPRAAPGPGRRPRCPPT